MREQIRKLERFWENLTERDGLIIVKLISSSIYQFRFVDFLLILYLIVQLSSQIVQIYLFAYVLNGQQFLQYSPAFFIILFGIVAAIIQLFDPRIVEDLFDEMIVRPIDEASETTKLKIKKEMRIVSIFTICNTIGVACLAFTLYFCNIHDYNMFLMVKYFTDYWPEYQNILTNIYKFSIAFVAPFISIAQYFQVIYYTQHIKYQFLMLIDQIDGITESENSDSLYPKVVDDIQYQQQVKAKLISFVKRSLEILMPLWKKIRQISNYIIIFTFFGLLTLVSCVYVIISNQTLIFEYEYYVPIVTLLAISTTSSTCIAGQSIETVAEDLHEALKQIKWYNVNVENCKIYSVMLSGTQKRVRFRFSENYSINYAIGLAVARGTYSILSILATFNPPSFTEI